MTNQSQSMGMQSGYPLLWGVAPTSDEQGSAHGGAARFVGRHEELAVLIAAVDEMRAGRGGVVLLSGEPGIGKSHLAEELARQGIVRGARVVWGRCWEGQGAPPFWPWAHVMRGLVGDYDPVELVADIGRGAQDILPVMPELSKHLPGVAVPPAAPESDHGRFRFFDSFGAFVRAATQRRPLLFILDDLHWADAGSLLLLQFLAGEVAHFSLLLVGTYRDVDPNPSPGLVHAIADVTRHRWSRRLPLNGFNQAEVAQFVAIASGAEPSRALVSLVRERTGGNPLFLAETMRLLVKTGQLGEDRVSHWGHVIPETLKDTITRRTSTFGPETMAVLEAASVVGPRFGLNLLKIVTGLEMERLLEVLDAALAARIVVRDEPRASEYHFAHAIVGDYFYDRLPAACRSRLHGRIADALERIHADSSALPLAGLAHHYWMASLGAERGKALEYAIRAGEGAMKHLAFEDAAMHYCRALEMLEAGADPDDGQRCRVLLALGEAQSQSGDWPAARQTYERAAATARDAGQLQDFGRAAIGYKRTVLSVPDDARAVTLLREALTMVGEGDSITRVRLLSALATSLHFAADVERPRTLAAAAVEMARRLGDPGALAVSLDALVIACWHDFGGQRVREAATEILFLSTQCRDMDLAFRGRMYRHCAFLLQGDREGSAEELELCSALADESCHPRHRWQVSLVKAGRVLAARGLTDAEMFSRSKQASLTGFRDSAADHYEVLQWYFALRFRGTPGDAQRVLEMMACRFPQVGPYRAVLAAVRALAQPASTVDLLAEFGPNDFEQLPSTFHIFSLTQLAEACHSVRDRERARALYELLLPHANENVVVSWGAAFDGSVSHFLGLLATTLERWEDAERHFDDALVMNCRMEVPPLVARTQHAYAGMLVERDAPADRARAAHLLGAAIATFRNLGMPGHLSRAEELLARLPALSCGQDPEALSTLSAPSEGEPLLDYNETDLGADTMGPAMPLTPARDVYVFRREGEYWTLAFRRAVSRVKDSRGLSYLVALLQRPDEDVYALDLHGIFAAEPATADGSGVWRAMGGELRPTGLDATAPGVDGTARQEYRRRLTELQSEIEEADRFHDLGRAEQLRAEFDRIGSELGRAYGLGGRLRRTGSAAERARVNVRNSIAVALRAIRRQDRRLWRHLSATIKTGSCCSYRPEEPIPWQF